MSQFPAPGRFDAGDDWKTQMQGLAKALNVLVAFTDAERPLGVNDIASTTGLSKSYVSRALKEFRESGLIEQDPQTRKYKVGIEGFALAAGYAHQSPLVKAAWPQMRELAAETSHTIFTSIRNHDHCRHVMAVEGPKYMESQWRVGIRLPLHATASGKLLLAFTPQDELETLLREVELVRYTDNTITDIKGLRAELGETRGRGYAFSDSESVRGLTAVALPIVGENEAVIASIGIIAPRNQLRRSELKTLLPALSARASKISAQMDARVYDFPKLSTV